MPDPRVQYYTQKNEEALAQRDWNPGPVLPEHDALHTHDNAPDDTPNSWWGTIRNWLGPTIGTGLEVAGNLAGMAWGGGYWDKLGDYSPTNAFTKVLGLPGDISRTAIHSALGGKSKTSVWDAIADRTKAARGMDLITDVTGYQPTAPGPNRSWGEAIGNTAAELATEIGTDPLTLVAIGPLSKGAKLSSSIGRQAMAKIAAGNMLGAAEDMARVGKSLKDLKGWNAVAGIQPTLAGRMAAGEQHVAAIHVPLVSLFGKEATIPIPFIDKALAPIVEKVANNAQFAKEFAEVTKGGRFVSKSAQMLSDFFFNPDFAHAGGTLQRMAEAMGNNEARQVVEDVMAMRFRLQNAGLKESQYARPMHMFIASMDKEGKDMASIRSAAAEIVNNWAPAKRDALLKEVTEYRGITQRMLESLQAHGVHIDDLGTAVKRELAIAAENVRLTEAEFGKQFTAEESAARARLVEANEKVNGELMKRVRDRIAAKKSSDYNPWKKRTPEGDILDKVDESKKLSVLDDIDNLDLSEASGGGKKVAQEASQVSSEPAIITPRSPGGGIIQKVADGKVGIENPQAAGPMDAWARAVDEYKPKNEGPRVVSTDPAELAEEMRKEFLRLSHEEKVNIMADVREKASRLRAIQEGQGHIGLGNTPDFQTVKEVAKSLMKASGGTLGENDAMLQAGKILAETGRSKLEDLRHGMALAENEYIRVKNIYDNTPNWVPLVATEDAVHAFVKDGGRMVELMRPDIRIAMERKVKSQNGTPLSAIQFNEIVKAKGGTEATAHMPVKGTMSISEAIDAYRKGGSAGVQDAAKKIGEFFEINPIVALESRLTKMPQAIAKAEQTKAVASFWGKKEPALGHVDLGRFDDKFSGTYVPQDVFEGLAKQWAVAKFQLPEVAVVTKMTYLTRLWKSFNTGALPVFHMRNKIGNIVRRLQEGAIELTPEAISNEWKINKGLFMAHQGASGGELNKLRLNLGNHGEMGFGDFLNESRKYNVMGQGEWAMDITDEMAARGDWLTRVMRKDLPGSPVLTKAVGKLLGTQSTHGASLTAVGKWVEDSDRLASFATFMRKGETQGGAAYLVDKTLFNYQHISPAVEIARKTGIFPFAAWSAKNIPAQVEVFLTRPGQFAAMLHARDVIEHGVPGLNREALPAYIKNKFNIIIGKDEKGENYHIVDLNGIIPLADLPDIVGPNAMREFFSRSFGPVPRILAHRLFNKNTFTLKDVERYDGQVGIYQTPLGPIPIDADLGYDIAAAMPRMPGALGRFDTTAQGAANWQGISNIANPIPVRNINIKEAAKHDIEFYKNQMSMAKADVNKWQRAGNRIMYDVAMKAYLKKKADLQKYLAASASRKDAP